jgi:hypothetical protein
MALGIVIPGVGAVANSAISFSGSGDQVVGPAAIALQMVEVYRLALVFGGTTNITFKDGSGGTALTGAMPFNNGGQLFLDISGENVHHFRTTIGNAFVINSSAAVQVSGWIQWIQRVP